MTSMHIKQTLNKPFGDSTTEPLVSIGVPVFNECKYIGNSLQSLLEQDYSNLEVIVSDNFSNDGTENIINNLCLSDERVKINRFDSNKGVSANFHYVYTASQGKYFMWASGHDLWSSNLVSECVNLLQSRPNAIIAYGTPEWIDDKGNIMHREFGWIDTRGMGEIGRFMSVFWGNMNPVLGVIRRDSLPNMETYYKGVGADLLLLLELSLKGDFIHAHNAKFYRRQPREIESYSQKLGRYKSAEVNITHSRLMKIFPLLRLPYEILKVVAMSDIRWYTKIGIFFILVPSLPIRYIAGRIST